MLRKIRFCMLIIAFALTFFAFSGANVNAAEINSAEDLVAFFEGKDVTITGNTVKLNSNVTFEDVLDVMDGEYTFDLNGKTLKIIEVYVLGGKLTINGTSKGSKFDSHYVSIEGEKSSLVANGVTFETDDTYNWEGQEELEEVKTVVDNILGGTVSLKDCTIEDSIWNTEAKMTLENVVVPIISQQGDAVIKGGKYESFATDLTLGKTTIYGGEFINKGEESHAFIINNNKKVDPYTIDELLPEGYVATFDDFDMEYYEYDGIENYTGLWKNNVTIIKEEELSKVYSDAFKKITSDGTWEIEALKPEDVMGSEVLFSALVRDALKGTGYEGAGYAFEEGDTLYPEVARVYISNGDVSEEHIVKVKYLDANPEKTKEVTSVLDKMKYWENAETMTVDSAYILDDLHLINYLFANTSTSKINGDQALNFAKDLIAATGGANISFEYDARSGSGNPYALYSHSSGQVVVRYDGKPFTSRYATLTASHVLYIPDTTKDTDEAYIAAALKRIKDYMGKDANITITVGGKLDSIEDVYELYNEYNLFDETKTGDNYYIVKINGKSYNFAICKKEASKLETPKYIGLNLGNDITITSDVTTIPLDTAISVKKVVNDNIEKILGTDLYAAFDIELFSNAKGTKITKLENGKFNVSIPIPDGFDGKDLSVYYINHEEDKDFKDNEEFKTVVKDGYLCFETNHFSTYVIAEKGAAISNPETSDNILVAVATMMIAMAGIVVGIKYSKN